MAVRTLSVALSLVAIANAMHTTKDIATLAAATSGLAKACEAFASVKAGEDRKAHFARIAGVARVSYDDACTLCDASAKDSTVRTALRVARAAVVSRIRSAAVVHDATVDAKDVALLDRIVSSLGTIAKHVAIVQRVHTCEVAAV